MRGVRDERIKLRHLQCALAVAEHRQLQAAAHRLAISQPAVSKTLKELEDILGVPLFQRGRRGAVPTAQGEEFLRHAAVSVSALRSGLEAIAAKARGAQALAVGVLPTVAPTLMPRVVVALWRAAPSVQLRVLTAANAELLTALKQGRVEAVVGRLSEPEQMTGVTFEHLYSDPLVVVARPGHPLLAPGGAPSFADLVRHPTILATPGTLIRHSAEGLLRSHGVAPPTDCIETLSISFARNLVRASDAVWFVPAGAVDPDLAAGDLVRLPVSTAGTEEPVGLLLRPDTGQNAALRAFVACLREEAAGRRAA